MDYKNGKIYKILNTITDDVYVGSTCQSLSKRMAKHRTQMNCSKHGHSNLYRKMKALGVGNFYIELIEECPCDNIEQLRAVKGKYIRELGTLNTRVEGRTKKQYVWDNKDRIKERLKNYQQNNKDTLKEKKNIYNQENMEIIKEKKKIYYQQNTEKIKDRQNKYREENIDIIKESHTCHICGGKYQNKNKQKHFRTKKHLKAVASQTAHSYSDY